MNGLFKMVELSGWRVDWGFRALSIFAKDPGSIPQHVLHGCSQPSITLIPGYLT